MILVGTAIIVVLILLLRPAIQQAREAARRAQGKNKMTESTEHFVICIRSNGHSWVFTVDPSPRSLSAFFDVLNEYERDPESGFTPCQSNHVLRELAHLLCENAESRRTGASLNGTAMKSSTAK